ncbi:hypothetical protein ACFLT8_00320 [Chloroflexota bacterium]
MDKNGYLHSLVRRFTDIGGNILNTKNPAVRFCFSGTVSGLAVLREGGLELVAMQKRLLMSRQRLKSRRGRG